ncbi:MAG TPA: pentapeptide repeat-containing protein [Terriglobales bacterium]|jgi:hypothetical protein|nr:pentapeptide repeat-containing protein [Terriglobales bacterium]
MIIREARERPLSWPERRKQIPSWSVPFFAIEWVWEWTAFLLSRWTFVVVLEYLGSLSILVAVFFYFHDSENRVKQRHYQAWQVINTAQGKGGSGGRIEALQELNEDGVPLVGVDVSGAFLQGVHLGKARLLRSDFSAADVRNSDFKAADLQDSDLHSANFRQSSFEKASLLGARMDDADLQGTNLSDADLSGATLDNADLRFVAMNNTNWSNIRSIKRANLFGVRNAPNGFLQWSVKHGAVQIENDDQWERSGPRQ